ncbi:MAG: threonine/serine dehydratase [Chloroflexi bacterium]|nr:threonine/serine dehydratase [Chloroflexota bacterium]
MQIPTLRDVYAAKKLIAQYLPRTPLHYSAGLSEVLEAQVYLKHEDHFPLGAFKQRGGINFVAHLTQEERDRGMITASTGNHGQSIASAGRIFGARVLVALPENANPLKVAAMRALGAELLFHGAIYDQAREYAERLAREEGYRYVHPSNEPLLISGVATQTLEIIEDLPDVQAILAPMGGGSGVAGTCLVAKAIDPSIQVLAVQAEAAPAGYLSWQQGQLVQAPMNTFAEGVATGGGYELPQTIIRHSLDDFILVSDDEIRYAMGLLIEKAHTLAEGAGAVATAGALKHREALKGKKVVIVVSGGNVTLAQVEESIKVYQKGR